MVVRYVVTRSHPIPIAFHWVLGAYLFTLGRVMRQPRNDASASSSPQEPNDDQPTGEQVTGFASTTPAR